MILRIGRETFRVQLIGCHRCRRANISRGPWLSFWIEVQNDHGAKLFSRPIIKFPSKSEKWPCSGNMPNWCTANFYPFRTEEDALLESGTLGTRVGTQQGGEIIRILDNSEISEWKKRNIWKDVGHQWIIINLQNNEHNEKNWAVTIIPEYKVNTT